MCTWLCWVAASLPPLQVAGEECEPLVCLNSHALNWICLLPLSLPQSDRADPHCRSMATNSDLLCLVNGTAIEVENPQNMFEITEDVSSMMCMPVSRNSLY